MKYIIFNEPDYRTGGVESLYQLCHIINEQGGEGYIHFVSNHPNPIPEEYKKYNIKTHQDLIDSPNHHYIIPEVWTEKVKNFTNSKKSIWWLSVNNNHGKFKDFDNTEITHFYQSEYANHFLSNNNVTNKFPLHDYIDGVIYDNYPKEKIICYNPAKGREASDFIIKNCPDIQFLPLVNMTKDDIISSLKKSMIYMDFGHHPGRDRIPREAAILNNIVLTSKIGSANFYEDISIPDKFKYESLNKSIREDIINIFDNYNEIINDFTEYRQKISEQKNIMMGEVKDILLT